MTVPNDRVDSLDTLVAIAEDIRNLLLQCLSLEDAAALPPAAADSGGKRAAPAPRDTTAGAARPTVRGLVARAIARRDKDRNPTAGGQDAWEQLRDYQREDYEDMAKAAIEAYEFAVGCIHADDRDSSIN